MSVKLKCRAEWWPHDALLREIKRAATKGSFNVNNLMIAKTENVYWNKGGNLALWRAQTEQYTSFL